MNTIKNAAVLGYGNVGKILSITLDSLGMLSNVISKSAAKDENIKAEFIDDINKIKVIPDALIISVLDRYIEEKATEIANKLGNKLKGVYVFHLSGTLKHNVLDKCREYGAVTASIHPFQTFFNPYGVNTLEFAKSTLNNTAWSIELPQDINNDETKETISNFIKTIYGNPIYISDKTIKNKSIYHAAAVAASNYSAMVLNLSYKLAKAADIQPEIYLPKIINTSINNNFTALKNDKTALTGPIVRGDYDILKQHIDDLKDNKHLRKSYCYFGLALLEMAKDENLIESSKSEQIEKLLKEGIK